MTVQELVELKFNTPGTPKASKLILQDEPVLEMTYFDDGIKLRMVEDTIPIYNDDEVKIHNEMTYEITGISHNPYILLFL